MPPESPQPSHATPHRASRGLITPRRLALAGLLSAVVGAGIGWVLYLDRVPEEMRAEWARIAASEALADGDHEVAVAQLRGALEYRPGDLATRVDLANALYELGRDDEARTELRGVLAESPTHADANILLASRHLKANEPAEAQSVALLLFESPDMPALLCEIGARAALQLGDVAMAAKLWRRAAEQSRGAPESWLRAAYAYELIAKTTLSRTAAQEAFRLLSQGLLSATRPEDMHRARRLDAEIHERRGEWHRALAILEGELETTPSTETFAALVQMRLRRGDIAGAWDAIDRGMATFPADPALSQLFITIDALRHDLGPPRDLLSHGIAWPDRGPNQIAVSVLEALGSCRDAPSGRRVWLGSQLTSILDLIATGTDDQSAVTAFEDELRLLRDQEPNDPLALLWSAAIAAQRGDLAEGARLIDETLTLDPTLTDARYVLGVIRLRSGDAEVAIRELRAAYEAGPRAPVRAAALTRALAAGGTADAAVDAATRAVVEWGADPTLAAALETAVRALPAASSSARAETDPTPLERAIELLESPPTEQRLDRVERLLDAAERRDAAAPRLRTLRARLLLARGRYREGADLSRELVEAYPRDADARSVMKLAWGVAGRGWSSRAVVGGGDTKDWTHAAIAFERAGDMAAAEHALRRAREHSDTPATRRHLARVLAACGQLDEASRVLSYVPRGEVMEPQTRIALGALHRMVGEPEKAAEQWRKVMMSAASSSDRAEAALALLDAGNASTRDGSLVAGVIAEIERDTPEHPLLGLLRGFTALVQRDLETAERLATAGLSEAGVLRAESLLLLAQVHALRGDLRTAVEHLADARVAEPSHGRVLSLLAVARLQLAIVAAQSGDLQEAARLLKSVISASHTGDLAAVLLGRVLGAARAEPARVAAVRAELDRQRDGGVAGPLFTAENHIVRGRRAAALLEIEAARDRDPNDLLAQAAHLRVLLALDEDGETVHGERAVTLWARRLDDGVGSTSAFDHLAFALALERVRRPAEATTAFRRCLEADPANRVALDGLLRTVRDLWPKQRQVEVVERALQTPAQSPRRAAMRQVEWLYLTPTVGLAYQGLQDVLAGQLQGPADALRGARARLAVGDVDRAVSALTSAVRENPNWLMANVWLLSALERAGQRAEARRFYTARISSAPQDATAWLLLGLIEENAGNVTAAEVPYRRAVAADPAHPIATNNLAWLLGTELDSIEEALTIARRARELYPRDHRIADTLGWLLHLSGDDAAAVRLLRSTASANPVELAPRLHLAEVLQSTGEVEAALAEYRAIMHLHPVRASEAKLSERIAELEQRRPR